MMSNRLAIDPSEIRLPDHAAVRRRLWGRPAAPCVDAAEAPVVKRAVVDFYDDAMPGVVRKPAKPLRKARPKREKPAHPEKRVDVIKLYRLAYASPGAPRRPLKQILEGIARAHQVSVGGLTGRRRGKDICDARQHAYYVIATERRDISYQEVARRFSDRDHSTLVYGAAAFAARHGLPPVVRS